MGSTRGETVPLPISVVWQLLTDTNAWTEWMPDARNIAATTGGGVRKGAEFRTNPNQGAMANQSTIKVTEFDPPHTLKFETRNIGKLTTALDALNRVPNSYELCFELSSMLNDPQATEVTLTADAEMSTARRRTGGALGQRKASERDSVIKHLALFVRYAEAYKGIDRTAAEEVADPSDLGAQWRQFARITAYPEKLRTLEGHAQTRESLGAFLLSDTSPDLVDFVLRIMVAHPPWLTDRYGTAFGRRQALRALSKLDTWSKETEWLRSNAVAEAARLDALLASPRQRVAWQDLISLLQHPDGLVEESRFDPLFEILMAFAPSDTPYREHIRLLCQGFCEWPAWVNAISADSDQPTIMSRSETSTRVVDGVEETSTTAESWGLMKSATRSKMEDAAKAYLRHRGGTDWWKAAGPRMADLTQAIEAEEPVGTFKLDFEYLPLIAQGPAKGRHGYMHYIFETQVLVDPGRDGVSPELVTIDITYDFGDKPGHVHKVHPKETFDVIGEANESHSGTDRKSTSDSLTASAKVPGMGGARGSHRHTRSTSSTDREGLRYKVEQLRVAGYAMGNKAQWTFATTDHKAAVGGFLIAAEVLAREDVTTVGISGVVRVEGAVNTTYREGFEYQLPRIRKAPPAQKPPAVPPASGPDK